MDGPRIIAEHGPRPPPRPHNDRMQAPFEPAPVLVSIRSPMSPERAAGALERAGADGAFVEPSADPVSGDRGLLRLDGGVVDGEVLLAAQRWTTRETKTRTPQPLTLHGRLEAAPDGAPGSLLEAEIVAPIARVLWFIPSAAFAFGLIAGLDGNLAGIVAGPLIALVMVAVFRLNQWDTLRDAPQLERGIRALLDPGGRA